jgi:hypothetical protein
VFSSGCTYIEQEFLLLAILSLLLEEDVTSGIDNQHFAVLSDDALLRSLGAGSDFRVDGRAYARATSLLCGHRLLVLAIVLVHSTLLSAVHRCHLLLLTLIPLLGVDGGGCVSIDTGDALQTALVAPRCAARMPDVPLGELAAAFPAHNEGEVVEAASHDHEETQDDRTKARAETLVVVSSASPLGEPVPQEVVISLAFGALQDIGNDGEPLVGFGGIFDKSVDFLLRGRLGNLLALLLVLEDALGLEALARLVGMHLARLFAVRLVQLVLRCRGLDAEQVVESDVGAVVGDDLIADAEDLVVCSAKGG